MRADPRPLRCSLELFVAHPLCHFRSLHSLPLAYRRVRFSRRLAADTSALIHRGVIVSATVRIPCNPAPPV